MPSRLIPLVLAIALVPLPVIGWIGVQGADDRIIRNSDYTGALVHTLSASTFAVILLLSALTNALIVSLRFRDGPHSYRATGYVLWQIILIALSIGWVVVVCVNYQSSYLELVLAVLIALVSIVVCVFASKRDPLSVERRDARRRARNPEVRQRMRRAGILVPSIALALGIVTAVMAQNVEVVHRGCTIIGQASVNGADSIITEECGSFAVDHSMGSTGELWGQAVITTRGYRLLPFEPLAISVEVAD